MEARGEDLKAWSCPLSVKNASVAKAGRLMYGCGSGGNVFLCKM